MRFLQKVAWELKQSVTNIFMITWLLVKVLNEAQSVDVRWCFKRQQWTGLGWWRWVGGAGQFDSKPQHTLDMSISCLSGIDHAMTFLSSHALNHEQEVLYSRDFDHNPTLASLPRQFSFYVITAMTWHWVVTSPARLSSSLSPAPSLSWPIANGLPAALLSTWRTTSWTHRLNTRSRIYNIDYNIDIEYYCQAAFVLVRWWLNWFEQRMAVGNIWR